MSKAAELQALLDSQPKLEGTALPPFSVEEADFDVGRVVLRFAPQPAFKNYYGNVQGGFLSWSSLFGHFNQRNVVMLSVFSRP